MEGLESDEAADTGDSERVRAVREEDAAGIVSGRDGTGSAGDPVVIAARTNDG